MTVLTFQECFVPRVLDGTKGCTIRAPRKRKIRAGDELSLRRWTGRPYMAPQEVLFDSRCTGISEARFEHDEGLSKLFIDGRQLGLEEWDALAITDGFDSYGAMFAWFRDVHGLPFTGTLIRWAPRSCSRCGCTWDRACRGGCAWIGPNLCSACDGFVRG